MTSFTDDEIRQIYKFLPLDQEPTIDNIERHIRKLDDHFDNEDRKIDEDWLKWKTDVNYDQFNRQYQQLLYRLRDLIDAFRRGSAEMVSLHWYNENMPTNYEEIESMILNRSNNFFDE